MQDFWIEDHQLQVGDFDVREQGKTAHDRFYLFFQYGRTGSGIY